MKKGTSSQKIPMSCSKLVMVAKNKGTKLPWHRVIQVCWNEGLMYCLYKGEIKLK